jgi:hypothetical protein
MKFALTIIHRYEDDPRFSVILGKQSSAMADLTKLQADVTALTAAVTAALNDAANLRAENATLTSQNASLTSQLAAAGSVSQSAIDAIDAPVAAAVTALTGSAGIDNPPAAASPPAGAPVITTDAG